MTRGYRTFKEFQQSGEGIATNILSDRLKKLEVAGILTSEVVAEDARRLHYRLTEKGIDLAPVLLELLIWGARHEKTGLPCGFIEQVEARREYFLTEARRRWESGDTTPLFPRMYRERMTLG
jgi:DNA-binding HxlR family transcriptional regulator